MKNKSQHEYFAQESLGISDNSIYEKIFEILKRPYIKNEKIIDIGCGEGQLLQNIKTTYPTVECFGVDIIDYEKEKGFVLFKQNLNENFNFQTNPVDIVIATEVIEHLENPRHFLKQLKSICNPQGHIIITTPNTSSLLSVLSYFVKGHHSSFGPKDYPAHITPVSPYQIENIVNEIEGLKVESIEYINNGRIPGTARHYSSIFPFLKGRYFSDNYCCIIKRI